MEEEDKELENIFAVRSEIKDIYAMIIDINDKKHTDIQYFVDINNDGKIIHVVRTPTQRFEFKSRTDACDFVLDNYGK